VVYYNVLFGDLMVEKQSGAMVIKQSLFYLLPLINDKYNGKTPDKYDKLKLFAFH
jgi:uncharacterized membrane protein